MSVVPKLTSTGRSAGSGARARRETPTFARGSDGRLVGGVAVGIARHLGVQPLTARIAFSLLSGLSGFGVVLYLALWIFTPLDADVARREEREAPAGIAAATRSGMRRGRTFIRRSGDLGQLAALVALGAGAILMFGQTPLGVSPAYTVPMILAAAGLTLMWRSADSQERRRMAELSPRAPLLGAIAGGHGWGAAVRVVAGVLVVVVGGVVFLAGRGQLDATVDALSGIVVLLVGISLILGPWLWQLWRTAESERRERIVTQERADMAAHLHDSVLQTLALIQKQAHEPRTVVKLARSQERDLRNWLYGDKDAADDTSLAAALTTAGAEVEDAFGVPVEVVTVGDAPVDDTGRALLSAAREAAMNAAKHSGAGKIDIYLEVIDHDIEIFVRDRGTGFDPEQIPDDRLGVRRSIIDRMRRHGGSAEVRSEPGSGTEVRLTAKKQ
ncbi:PspC domain-containing protein [Phytoactinopolyspora alkaliphila]|uniref:PspC domain-containing protein n=1 Tax=Phytoactinopolyspora alkaliphila TaxID=1783498 RepID=A0A6N9YJJ6_9ACTN|nr:PspC domain-containing protein [Phytoactinopolyspora alkaliphila]